MASPKGMGTKAAQLDFGKAQKGSPGGETDMLVGRPPTPPPVSWSEPHGTTPTFYLVALGAEGVAWVTGTWLAAPAAGQLPVVGSTLVTFGAHHVGQTQAAPTLLVTRHVLPGPQDAAVTACKKEGC